MIQFYSLSDGPTVSRLEDISPVTDKEFFPLTDFLFYIAVPAQAQLPNTISLSTLPSPENSPAF